jgi:molecular chaperone GrpE (heat shock protein)
VIRTPTTGTAEEATQATAAELRDQIKEHKARIMELYRTGKRDQLPREHQILEQMKARLQRVETAVPSKGIKGVPPRRRKPMAASDPQRAAEVLIKQMGADGALTHARKRADELSAAGDRAGTEFWDQILSAIDQLGRKSED